MAKYPNDDLFENTKMSFGQHLEELRVSLFKAVLGLLIGFVIGLLISSNVMAWMQSPLTRALENYYIDKAIDDLQVETGAPITPELKQFIIENRLVFDDILIDASEIRRIAGIVAPPASDGTTDGPKTETSENKPASADGGRVAESNAASTASNTEAGTAEKPKDDGAKASDTAAKEPTPPAAVAESKKPESKSSEPSDASGTPGLKVVKDKIPTPSSMLVSSRIWKPAKMDVRSLNAQEAFMIWMKAGLITGIVVSSPWIFLQIWNFVAAGLYPHEKNYVYIYLPFSLLLFLAGAAMAFFAVFDPVLNFLFSFNKALNIDPDPRISEWLGFVLILPLGFGISFQLPLVMLFLNRLNLLSLEMYVEKWRVAVLAIFIISAILTPADPISIFLMAGPLTVLYFLGLGLCKWMPRNKNPYAETYTEE